MHAEDGLFKYQIVSCSAVGHRHQSLSPKSLLFFLPSVPFLTLTFPPLVLSFQVLTFDGSGVSGHANHVAIYKAIR